MESLVSCKKCETKNCRDCSFNVQTGISETCYYCEKNYFYMTLNRQKARCVPCEELIQDCLACDVYQKCILCKDNGSFLINGRCARVRTSILLVVLVVALISSLVVWTVFLIKKQKQLSSKALVSSSEQLQSLSKETYSLAKDSEADNKESYSQL